MSIMQHENKIDELQICSFQACCLKLCHPELDLGSKTGLMSKFILIILTCFYICLFNYQ
jgi:hypothetical protein